MSFAVTPAQPKPRPTTVTVAVYLLYLVAAIEVISSVVSLSSMGKVREVYEDAYKDTTDGDAVLTVVNISTIGTVIFALLLAAGFVALAILNGKGKNPARIVTWVLAGLGVLCFGCGAIAQSTGAGMGGGSTNGGPDPADVQKQVEDALPAWQTPFSVAAVVISLIALLAVIVLLALPASGAFFAKEQEVWVPPTAWPAPGGGDTAPPTAPPSGGAPPPLS